MDMQPQDTLPAEAPAERIRHDGDRLRNSRAWEEAAEAYGQYLRLCPEDGPIWVQYGHCLKESGDTKGALLCYREAERLLPEDSDVQLQIGHALKRLDRQEEAFGAYAMALTLDPGNVHARRELLGNDEPVLPPPAAATPEAPLARPQLAPAPAPAPTAGGALVFDVSDLLDYFRANRAPTGIQRVQLNIVREALDRAAGGAALVAAFDPRAGAWKPLPAEHFQALAALSASGAEALDPEWVALVASVAGTLRAAAPLEFRSGSALVNLGTSWWIPDYLRRVRDAKARFGIRYVPFLHDCIPLLVPEHCAENLVGEFARWFSGLCLHADAVLANSDCTRADFRHWQRRVLPTQEIPCFTVPLDGAPPDATPPDGTHWPPSRRRCRPCCATAGPMSSWSAPSRAGRTT